MHRLLLLAAFAWTTPALAQTGDAATQGVLAGVTGPDGEVHLRLEDGGFIAVRPGTKMRITNCRAQGDEGDRLTIGLLEGTFRSVTGWVAKLSTRAYTVRTPMATIGVRGTDHEPFHIPEGSALGEPGTYDKVNEGGTFLQTERGRVDVAPGRAAFAHLKRAERPRVLDRMPGHFRPTRHEPRIAQRYHEIQQRLPQLREERRARIEQKAEQRKKARELREHKLKKKHALKKRE
jgi:hypothetical protein